jgi:hypothetical protein
MYFGAVVGVYLFRMIQCADMEHIKFGEREVIF